MKKFCLHCGCEISYPRKKFCTTSCSEKHYYTSKPRTIENYFKLFKGIVAASATPAEFYEYYKTYFGGKENV